MDRPYAVSTQETENAGHVLETFTQEEHGDDYRRRAMAFAQQTSVRVWMVPVVVDEVTGPGDLTERHRFLDGEEVTGQAPASRSAAYELGRARGYVTRRTEPDESDRDFASLSMLEDHPGSVVEDYDFETGMLDGAEQAETRRLGLPVHAPKPSDEALAAARVGMVST